MLVKRSLERGQALVILALGIFALVGMTALAIDGGNVFSDRRKAQNAADTSVLAAALAKVRGENWTAAAQNRANDNGYNNDFMTNRVQVFNPPTSGPYAGNNEYIQVVIISNVDTYFGPVIGWNSVTNQVDAIAKAKSQISTELYEGNVVVGLSPNDCQAVVYQGNSNTTLTGGGLFVNSDCNDAALFNQSGAAQLTADPINIVGGYTIKPGSVNGTINTGATPYPYPPDWLLPNPVCSGNATQTGSTLSPGNVSGTFPPSGVTDLNPGLYCVNGSFSIQNQTLRGPGVTIAMMTGDIHWTGGDIQLSAPTSGEFQGLLIYMPLSNTSPITFNGNATWDVTGTILALASNIQVSGNQTGMSLSSQVIGYKVELTGDGTTTLNYNSGLNYKPTYPAKIELTK